MSIMDTERKPSVSDSCTMSDKNRAEHVIGLVTSYNSPLPNIKREVLSDESEQEFVEDASDIYTKTDSAIDDSENSHHTPEEHPSERNVNLGTDFHMIKLEKDGIHLKFDSDVDLSDLSPSKECDTSSDDTSRESFVNSKGVVSTSRKKSKLLKKRSKSRKLPYVESMSEAPNDTESYRLLEEEIATLTCADCGKKCSKRYTLSLHKMRHAPRSQWRFPCTYCERRYVARKDLKRHLVNVHEVEMPVVKEHTEYNVKTENRDLNSYQPSAEERNSLTCADCEKQFTSRRILYLHKLRHLPKEEWNFPCSLCDRRFVCNMELKRHIRCAHTKEAQLECLICHKHFKLKTSLNEHMEIHDKESSEFDCTLCTKTFKKAQLLDNHVKYTHHNIPCVACKLVFQKVTLYRRHYEETHASNTYEVVNCSRCEQKYENKQLYEQHLTSHVGEPNFHLCSVCFCAFELPWSLSIHSGMHEELIVNKESCPLCVTNFMEFRGLKRHLLTVHAGDNLKTCPTCGIELDNENWKQHIESHVGQRSFICSVCGKAYATKSSLSYHMQNVYAEKPTYFCEQCSNSLKAPPLFNCCYDVMEHVTNEHGSKPVSEIDSTTLIAKAIDPDLTPVSIEGLVCSVCGWEGEDVEKLRAHLARHERKEKKFYCDHCGRMFTRIKSLKCHVRLTHNPNGGITCEICGKSFIYRSNMKRHLMSHEGVKAFSCHICAQTFTQKQSLNSHLMVHNGMKPYQCDFCDKCFTQKSNRKTHMKRCRALPQNYL